MKNRIKYLILFLIIIFISKIYSDNNINNTLTVISKSFSINKKIPVILKWNHYYVSLNDFSRAIHFGIYTNEQRHKTVLYLIQDRITFTSENTLYSGEFDSGNNLPGEPKSARIHLKILLPLISADNKPFTFSMTKTAG